MIQYYLDLQKQLENIKDHTLSEGQIQKIYSTAFYISLTLRARGKTWHLYLGRGGGYEGIWLHDSAPPSQIRRKDNFLEYLRRHLTSCSFKDITIDKHDRIVRIDYRKFGQVQSFLVFWKARKMYFVHHYQDSPETPFKLLLSWRGKSFIPGSEIQDLFSYFDDAGRNIEMKHDLFSPEIPQMGRLIQEEIKASEIKSLTSAPAFLKRKKLNIEDDLRKAKQWDKLQSILDKGDSLENIYELKVGDHKIKFEGDLNPYERRNLLFQKIKKLKRGESILKGRLGDVEEELEGKSVKVTTESVLPLNKPIWGEEKSQSTPVQVKQAAIDFKVFDHETFQIGVGMNAQGNDQLRSKWAGKDDYWLHLDGLKSTHVIIKMKNNLSLSPEILNVAASIVAHFSHFSDEWIPIIHTQMKNLKGVSGAAGMVIYKKEKRLRCPKVKIDDLIKD